MNIDQPFAFAKEKFPNICIQAEMTLEYAAFRWGIFIFFPKKTKICISTSYNLTETNKRGE
jgi:hypothetical protein